MSVREKWLILDRKMDYCCLIQLNYNCIILRMALTYFKMMDCYPASEAAYLVQIGFTINCRRNIQSSNNKCVIRCFSDVCDGNVSDRALGRTWTGHRAHSFFCAFFLKLGGQVGTNSRCCRRNVLYMRLL